MNLVYPVVIQKTLKKNEDYLLVYIPDLDTYTQGKTVAECMSMARDAIGLYCLSLDEDKKETFPVASELAKINCNDNEFVTLVDVDYDEYKKKHSLKTVRRNVTLPSWLNYEAEKSGVNVSAVLARALKKELHLADRQF